MHWAKRSELLAADKNMAWLQVKQTGFVCNRQVRVTITRVAPRKLDDDNLAGALKGIRDGIADALLPANRGNQNARWADDGGGAIVWEYKQERGRPKEHLIRIRVFTLDWKFLGEK